MLMQIVSARPAAALQSVAHISQAPLSSGSLRLPYVFDALYNELISSIAFSTPAHDRQIIRHAYIFAYQAHLGQRRASGAPFFTHPVAVAHLLAKMGQDSSTIAAALLHDVVEDTSVTTDQLKAVFGNEIATLVESVTKPQALAAQSPEQAQLATHWKLIKRIRRDRRVAWIKLADRLHNLSTLHALDPDRQRRIVQETRQFYIPLAHELQLVSFVAAMEFLIQGRPIARKAA